MFSPSRASLFQLIPVLCLTLSACSSFLGPRGTPTPLVPTATPVPPTATPEPAAATVNGEIISVVEYRAELARYESAQKALGKTVGEADAGETVLADLIAQRLLGQGARAAGYEVSDSALQTRLDELGASLGGEDQLAAWQSAHGYTRQTFSAALRRSMEAAWMRDKVINAIPATAEQVQLRQILLNSPEAANQAMALLKNGADFGALAARYDPVTHGELGWVPKGYLLDPKIEEAAFALQAGTHSDVIVTELGYHIVMVVARGEHPLSPDARLVLQELALKDWVAQQRTQSAIILAP